MGNTKRYPYKYLLRLDEQTWNMLESVAFRFGETKSRVLRALIRYYINQLADKWRYERYYG